MENSKPYRLLNLDSSVIVESRDVKFIENKFCSDSTSKIKPIARLPNDIVPSYSMNHKRKECESSFEPRRSQRKRKEKSLGHDFISSQALPFLVRR